jgi:hypothetical protein
MYLKTRRYPGWVQDIHAKMCLQVMPTNRFGIQYFGARQAVGGDKVQPNVHQEYQADGEHQPIVDDGCRVDKGELVGDQDTAGQHQDQDHGIPAESKTGLLPDDHSLKSPPIRRQGHPALSQRR